MIYQIGEVVNHISMLGPMTVLARITVESVDSETMHIVEIMYRCRCFDGMARDFFHYELKKRFEPAQDL